MFTCENDGLLDGMFGLGGGQNPGLRFLQAKIEKLILKPTLLERCRDWRTIVGQNKEKFGSIIPNSMVNR